MQLNYLSFINSFADLFKSCEYSLAMILLKLLS